MTSVESSVLRIDAGNPFYTSNPRDIITGLVESVANVCIGSFGACTSLLITLITSFRRKHPKSLVKHLASGLAVSSFLAVLGVVSAAAQALRGALNTPKSVIYYITNRKMWDEEEACWKSYSLLSEYNRAIEKGSFADIITSSRNRCEAHLDYQHNPAKDTSLYERLCISPSASFDEVKVAYFQLALTQHPDKNHSPDATQNFQKITEAYRILSNPRLRHQYHLSDSLDSSSDALQSRLENLRTEAVTKLLQLFGGKAVHALIGPGISYFYFLEGTWLTHEEKKQLDKNQEVYMALISAVMTNVFMPDLFPKDVLQKGFDLLNDALNGLDFPAFSVVNPLNFNYLNQIINTVREAPLGKPNLYLIGSAYINIAEDYLAAQHGRYATKILSKVRGAIRVIHRTVRMSITSASLAKRIIRLSRKVDPKKENQTREVIQAHMPQVSHLAANLLWFFWAKCITKPFKSIKGLLLYDSDASRENLGARAHALVALGEYLKMKGEKFSWGKSQVDILSFI